MAEHTRRTVLRGTAGPGGGTSRRRDDGSSPSFPGGAFAPLTEELTAFDLPVTGRVRLRDGRAEWYRNRWV
ncbi:hypothetical protein [Streptomyces sp. NPDC002078]